MTLAGFLCDRQFLTLAASFGTFFGIRGVLMVLAAQLQPGEPGKPGPWDKRSPRPTKFFAIFELIFQFWFNFMGGVVGWIAVAFLWYESFSEYGWKDLVTVIVAFLGITGHLPHLSTGVRDALVVPHPVSWTLSKTRR